MHLDSTRSRRSLPERLWSKIAIGEPDACWLWTAGVGKDGYGTIGIGGRAGRERRAHRVVWELLNGPIPSRMGVCHTCDVPRCCNPRHLFLGTQADNMADMVSKGRSSKGEQRRNTKITSVLAREIKALLSAGAMSQDAIAEHYGISQPTVSDIKTGKTWRHI